MQRVNEDPHKSAVMVATNLDHQVPAIQHVSKQCTRLLERYFYFSMALLIPAIVAFGFSFTIGSNLLHPAVPRPLILYVHATVFSFWLLFFLIQSTFVRTRHVRCHRLVVLLVASPGMV